MPTGFNITELPAGMTPFTSAFGLTGVPQEKNGAYPESNPYLKFFGMPVRNGQVVAPPQNREHFDWAEAYDQASVPTMTEYTITQLRESDMVLCRTVLPFVITEDKIDIKWNEWHFNDAMLDPRPAETASRLLSCNFTQGSDTMQTMGRAMEMEDGFYKTAAGQMHFIMQWKQIVNATAMTLEFGAATALANVREPGNAQMEQLRSGISSEQLRAVALREVNLFNCITRGGGLDIAIEHTERILASRGITTQIDTVIVPDGTAKHINDPSFRPFFMTGVPVPEHPSTEVRYKNKRIIASRLHSVGGEGPPQDPHFRWVTTGSFYVSDHTITYDMPNNDYTTPLRTEQVWDEDEDDYRFITLEEMVTNSGLFKVNGNGAWSDLTTEIGTNFFKGCETIGDFYDVQGKTIRLKEEHYKSDETTEAATQGYQTTLAAGCVIAGGVQWYANRAASLRPSHGPGDAFISEFLVGEVLGNYTYFETAQDLIYAILDAPIKHIGLWFQWCITAHAPIPISFVLANPYQRWYAGTLQTMRAGTDLGGTFIGHFDVQAGRDYVRKMLGLHVTAMMKSIVVNPKLIANAHNVLVKGYDGGGGTSKPWVPTDVDHLERFKRGNSQLNDQFTFAVTRLRPNWAIDIVGRFNPRIVTSQDNRDATADIQTARGALASVATASSLAAEGRRGRFNTFFLSMLNGGLSLAQQTGIADGSLRAAYDRRPQLPRDHVTVVYNNLLRQRLHYTSAEIYRGHWGFEHFDVAAPSTVATTTRPKTNTICMPGHQISASPTTSKHTLVRISKDHRGPWVYPGCAKVRTGLEVALRPPAYIGADVATSVSAMSIIG